MILVNWIMLDIPIFREGNTFTLMVHFPAIMFDYRREKINYIVCCKYMSLNTQDKVIQRGNRIYIYISHLFMTIYLCTCIL